MVTYTRHNDEKIADFLEVRRGWGGRRERETSFFFVERAL
jgi:hypothetical protein